MNHAHGHHQGGHHCHAEHGGHDHGAKVQPPAQDPAGPGATIYTCPMHPQIRQQGPGNCPICGMALEPLAPAAE